jgi:hypothetical protein
VCVCACVCVCVCVCGGGGGGGVRNRLKQAGVETHEKHDLKLKPP